MFFIHGVTGQTFRGSLENLEQVLQVPGALAARHARGVNLEGGEPGAECELVNRRLDGGRDAAPDPRYAEAAAALADPPLSLWI